MMRCISFIKKRRRPENFAKSSRIFMKYFKFLIKHVWKSASVYTSSIFVYKLEWLSERPLLSSWSVYHSYRIRKRILILLPYWKAGRYLTLYQKCSLKKLFLKILQYSQENTCAGVSYSWSCWNSELQLY